VVLHHHQCTHHHCYGIPPRALLHCLPNRGPTIRSACLFYKHLVYPTPIETTFSPSHLAVLSEQEESSDGGWCCMESASQWWYGCSGLEWDACMRCVHYEQPAQPSRTMKFGSLCCSSLHRSATPTHELHCYSHATSNVPCSCAHSYHHPSCSIHFASFCQLRALDGVQSSMCGDSMLSSVGRRSMSRMGCGVGCVEVAGVSKGGSRWLE
jgi:hypothetical protein